MKARLTRLLHGLQTQGQTPVQKAAAVALGLFIGATPFFGLHFLMSVLLGRALRLNIIRVYVAANISNPIVAPLLTLTEIQTGAWLRIGRVYTFDHTPADIWSFTQDLLIGTVVIGGLLAALGFILTLLIASRRGRDPLIARLFDETAARYLSSGPTAWQFAQNKLSHDPLYQGLLTDAALPSEGRLIDIGCGQGLSLALLATARSLHAQGVWPVGWAPPPAQLELWGIDHRARVVATARRALESDATVVNGDMREVEMPQCRVALLCDVLHLAGREDQDRLLDRVVDALDPGGLVVVREADASGGWRFEAVRVGNTIVAASRGHFRPAFHFRTAEDWRRALITRGLDVTVHPSGSKIFGNVVMYARKPRHFAIR
jgi:uncharacterized protein (DUF2062 family)